MAPARLILLRDSAPRAGRVLLENPCLQHLSGLIDLDHDAPEAGNTVRGTASALHDDFVELNIDDQGVILVSDHFELERVVVNPAILTAERGQPGPGMQEML
jgi:hypothetical protein